VRAFKTFPPLEPEAPLADLILCSRRHDGL
jgi:hypothetical protein